jgi:hypothetical protein
MTLDEEIDHDFIKKKTNKSREKIINNNDSHVSAANRGSSQSSAKAN